MTKKQYSAILFLFIGLIFLLLSSEMDLGTLSKMGPGMYPFIISSILIFISIIYVFQSQESNETLNLEIGQLIKMLLALGLSIVAFKYLGILASILILVPLVSTLHKDWSIRHMFIATFVASLLAIILKFTVLKALPLW